MTLAASARTARPCGTSRPRSSAEPASPVPAVALAGRHRLGVGRGARGVAGRGGRRADGRGRSWWPPGPTTRASRSPSTELELDGWVRPPRGAVRPLVRGDGRRRGRAAPIGARSSRVAEQPAPLDCAGRAAETGLADAVETLARSLARSEGPRGVRVNTVTTPARLTRPPVVLPPRRSPRSPARSPSRWPGRCGRCSATTAPASPPPRSTPTAGGRVGEPGGRRDRRDRRGRPGHRARLRRRPAGRSGSRPVGPSRATRWPRRSPHGAGWGRFVHCEAGEPDSVRRVVATIVEQDGAPARRGPQRDERAVATTRVGRRDDPGRPARPRRGVGAGHLPRWPARRSPTSRRSAARWSCSPARPASRARRSCPPTRR